MIDEIKPFEYSAEQWSVVVGTIPAATAADADAMLARQKLEAAATGYLTLAHHHRIRFAKAAPAKVTLRVHDQIKAAIDYADKTANSLLKIPLQEALKVMYATTQVEAFAMLRLSRKGRTDPARDLLNYLILNVWTSELKGKLTTGRSASAGRRAANSPANRFLIAALKPLLVIGPEAAEKIIEAERQRRAGLKKRFPLF